MDDESQVPVLWHSNAPWVGTGYGAQSALFAPLLADALNWKLAFSAFYGLRGSRLSWVAPVNGKAYSVYPGGRDAYSNDVLGAHTKHWFQGEGGLVVLLTDPWVMSADICSRLPLVAWVPIDHDPIIPMTKSWLQRSDAIPLAMSRFGQRVMVEAGFKNALYAPHGFDPRMFNTGGDRFALRKQLGIPEDAFIVGMVAANKGVPGRKGFPEAIRAFAELKRHNPKAVLYLHTTLEDPEGENLMELCRACGVTARSSDQYGLALGMPTSVVSALMRTFDVLLNPAYGEGFGVPMIEAQACGTPVICTDFTASPEVAPAEHGNFNVDGIPRWSNFESWQMIPSIDGIAEALITASEESADLKAERRMSVASWAQNYTVENVMQEHFIQAMHDAVEAISWRDQRMMPRVD